jgi:hypothetical protein
MDIDMDKALNIAQGLAYIVSVVAVGGSLIGSLAVLRFRVQKQGTEIEKIQQANFVTSEDHKKKDDEVIERLSRVIEAHHTSLMEKMSFTEQLLDERMTAQQQSMDVYNDFMEKRIAIIENRIGL